MSEEERSRASARITQGVAAWVHDHPAVRCLAIFAALPGEPDLALLHDDCPGVELCYPLVLPGRQLSFHRVADPEVLVCNAYGIPEPDPRRDPEQPVETLDAFVCPGLAFDPFGTRLGRGGGFYDRALDLARAGTPRVGVCFEAQRAPELPREPHDIVMTHLAGESGVVAVTSNPAGSS